MYESYEFKDFKELAVYDNSHVPNLTPTSPCNFCSNHVNTILSYIELRIKIPLHIKTLNTYIIIRKYIL